MAVRRRRRCRGERLSLLERIRLGAKRRRRLHVPAWPPEEDAGPPFEEALVPVGPPRRPRPSLSVALPLPEPPRDVDAYAAGP